ncbi:hypothetical protein C0581_04980 [Candidatus Parcubacteria bacterium]|nr:MAG: hypothetical protein C0581_04980 [Candidatus Parcubacteria bacterium]
MTNIPSFRLAQVKKDLRDGRLKFSLDLVDALADIIIEAEDEETHMDPMTLETRLKDLVGSLEGKKAEQQYDFLCGIVRDVAKRTPWSRMALDRR